MKKEIAVSAKAKAWQVCNDKSPTKVHHNEERERHGGLESYKKVFINSPLLVIHQLFFSIIRYIRDISFEEKYVWT